MIMREQFEAFDAANPRVWELFCQFTENVLAAGHAHYSADAILHRIRWHTDVETRQSGRSPDGHELKLNNNFAAFYARKWAAQNPERKDFFRMRVSVADQSALALATA